MANQPAISLRPKVAGGLDAEEMAKVDTSMMVQVVQGSGEVRPLQTKAVN